LTIKAICCKKIEVFSKFKGGFFMKGCIMLKSTHRILKKKQEYLEGIIKKNKYSDRSQEIKEHKIRQALVGAQEIAPYLRRCTLIDECVIPQTMVIFGCTLHLEKKGETRIITILGEPDLRFNPRYRSQKGFIAYGSDESLKYVGKKKGNSIGGWRISRIERFKE
jgi:transcription elongation GreA/GreB family factor